MNNDDQNEGVNAAKKGAQKAGQATKKGLKGASRLILFIFNFWWLILIGIVIIAIMTSMMYLVSVVGGTNGNDANPCTTGVNSSVDNKANVKNAQNPSSRMAIEKLAPTARSLAPKQGVLPSLVLADAGVENPTGPNNNYWGVGYYDNTTSHNQGYQSLENGMNAYLGTAISDTVGRVQTKKAEEAMRGMADADGQHHPLLMYHKDSSADYYSKLKAQYETYNLAKYDKGVKINTNIKKGSMNNIQSNADEGAEGDCTDNNTTTTTDGIYNFAQRYDGEVPYSQVSRYEFGDDLPNPKGSDQADCSSFIWGILKGAGYKVTKSQWTTDQMVNTPELQHISSKSAKQGDILVIPDGKKAHAMILASDKWYGATNGKTRVIDEGGAAANVNQSSYAGAMDDPIVPTFLRAIKK